MRRLFEAIWRLMLLVELSRYLNRRFAGWSPAHHQEHGRHRAGTVARYSVTDTLFLAELADLLAALGAGTAVAA